MLLSRSGRRRNGLSAGVAPPITMWLPPPVPVWRPSRMNFSVREARRARVGVEALRDVDGLAPGARRMQVHLQHAGVGRHLDELEARIDRRRVAFDVHRQLELGGRRLDRRDDRDVILQRAGERHEHAQLFARLDRERGAHRTACHRPAARRRRQRGIGQGGLRRHRIGRGHIRIVVRLELRQRGERQARAGRQIARQQEQVLAPHVPGLAHPRVAVAAQRQDERRGRAEPAREGAHDARARRRVEQFRIARHRR